MIEWKDNGIGQTLATAIIITITPAFRFFGEDVFIPKLFTQGI